MSKKKMMDELISEVETCQRCRLWKDTKNAVPGEGSLYTSLMFIGEAPGYWEDVKGRPFVGRAGRILDELLSDINLARKEIYITNLVKHRPPGNRDPRQDEIEFCALYLDKQIQIIKPKILATLGRHSTIYILSRINIEVAGITEARKQVYSAEIFDLNLKIVPTFHPAAALYNPQYKSELKDDFKTIKSELEKI